MWSSSCTKTNLVKSDAIVNSLSPSWSQKVWNSCFDFYWLNDIIRSSKINWFVELITVLPKFKSVCVCGGGGGLFRLSMIKCFKGSVQFFFSFLILQGTEKKTQVFKNIFLKCKPILNLFIVTNYIATFKQIFFL